MIWIASAALKECREGEGDVAESCSGAKVPSLVKEGWMRPLRKWREASLAGADGVVR